MKIEKLLQKKKMKIEKLPLFYLIIFILFNF